MPFETTNHLKEFKFKIGDPYCSALFRIIDLSMRGLVVSQFGRSFGPCLVMNFGRIYSLQEINRKAKASEWNLIIEEANWSIRDANKSLINHCSPLDDIDSVIKRLENCIVNNIVMSESGDFEINFDNELTLEVNVENNFVDDPEDSTNWYISYWNCWSICNEGKGAFCFFESDSPEHMALINQHRNGLR